MLKAKKFNSTTDVDIAFYTPYNSSIRSPMMLKL